MTRHRAPELTAPDHLHAPLLQDAERARLVAINQWTTDEQLTPADTRALAHQLGMVLVLAHQQVDEAYRAGLDAGMVAAVRPAGFGFGQLIVALVLGTVFGVVSMVALWSVLEGR